MTTATDESTDRAPAVVRASTVDALRRPRREIFTVGSGKSLAFPVPEAGGGPKAAANPRF